MTSMIWFDICLAVVLMLPLVGIPAWLIARGPQARAATAASARPVAVGELCPPEPVKAASELVGAGTG